MITYAWTIPTLEHEIADGGVYVAHWRCTGVDGDGNSAASYGTCGLTYDASSEDFIPYDDLTEAQVQEWIWEQVNQADTEASIASKIDAIANPTSASGTPWAASTEETPEE
tara:strand:+ start:1835 stop:2167 length:333 start_codon:yes stop_codon:yes gene_type:complete